jgi:hypothetical protein
MANNDTTYNDLLALRDRLDARQSELQAEIEDVTRKLESVSTTLALLDGDDMPLSHRTHINTRPLTATPLIDIAALRGLKQVQALVKIAEHGGGVLHTVEAKKLMLQAGLISNPKNAANILFSVMQRCGKFERVEPGVYRLIGDSPERPQRPPSLPLPGMNERDDV